MNTLQSIPLYCQKPGHWLKKIVQIGSKRCNLLSGCGLLFALSLLTLLTNEASAAGGGGGYTACGLTGEYYANTTLTAPVAFTRQDNRVDFDWSTSQPIGGSNSPAYSVFPHDNFSVRWTGSIVPRFTESYVFKVSATTGVRLWVNGTLVVDKWSTSGTFTSAGIALTADNTYSIKLEYLHLTGTASVSLLWSSPSTPEEVIDPTSVQSINLSDYPSQLFANAIKVASVGGTTGIAWFDMSMNVLAATQVDSQGWPLLDSQMSVTTENGRYLLVFNGKADVVIASRWFGTKGSFVVNGVTYTTLPSGIGYDAATNTTIAEVNSLGAVNGSADTNLRFTNSQRTSSSAVGTGVTNVQLYRPTTYNGSTYSPRGSIAAVNIKPVLQNYAVMRYFSAAFGDERSWDERVQPGFPLWNNAPAVVAPLARGNNKACWEYLIMLANEVGKDLYISISPRADHDYYLKLANLVKYGSDGTLPYTSTSQWPVTGPVFPPLNPNLRFHVEFSNEVWNYGFSMNGWIYQDSKDAVDLALGNTLDHTPPSIVNAADGLILNYDGNGWGNWKRWQALQTLNLSNTFRSVFGDSAMGKRIRILLFDQYGAYGSQMTQFIDNYFNKSDPASTYTGVAHPVSYYIWGGGGAIYYSSSNSQGIDPSVVLGNSNFEEPVLSAEASVSAPSGASWTFAGNAGIYHGVERTAVTGQTFGATSTAQRSVGFKFTVGANPIYVYQLGRYVSAKGGSRTLHLYSATGTNLVTTTNLDTSNKTIGQYAYLTPQLQDWPFNQNNPIVLAANTTYYLICDENGNSYYDGTTAVTAGPGFTIDGAVTYANSTFTVDQAGSYSYGPLNFIYTTTPNGSLGIVQNAPSGKQGAYIGDTGSISQTITVPTAGVYSLYMNAGFQLDYAYWLSAGTRRSINGNPINITIDGVLCNAASQTNPPYMVSTSKWSPGGWGIRDFDLWVNWGTAPLQLTAGTHTIKFEGTGVAGKYIFLDNIRVCSEAALFGPNASNFPSNGEAYGQDNSSALAGWASFAKTVCNWPITWGMKALAYEGGNSLGGDFTQSPLNSYCKYVSPLATQADIRAIDTYTRAGGSFFGHYYTQWYGSTPDDALNAPLVQSAIQKNNLLPAEANNGNPVPRAIPGAQHTLAASASNGVINARNGWCSYNIIVQQYGSYQITCNTQGGGTYHLQLDDGTRLLSNATAGGSVTTASVSLTAGMHNLRLQSTSASTLTVNSVTVFMAGAPDAPALSPAYTFANGQCQISWAASSGAVSYGVDMGTTSNNYTQSFPVAGTTTTITGLDDNTVYYLTVYARDASGLRSLYSSELRVAQRSSDPTALIDFEEQPITATGGYATEPLTSKGFTFTSEGNSAGTALVVTGTGAENWPGHYPSVVVQARVWGASISMTKTGGGTFDLHSLYLDSHAVAADYAIITATDPTGLTFKQTVNLATANTATPILNWVRVTKVNVAFYRASDARQLSGAIDNILVNPPVPTITTTALPNALTGQSYTANLSASGGTGALTWSIDSGSLPAGLALSTSGLISGIPTASGPSNFVVSVTDTLQLNSTKSLSISVSSPLPVISSALTSSGTAGVAYSYTITASNSPTSYSASGLPAGLSVNTSTGVISGIPSVAGTSNITLSATNASGTGSASLVLTVAANGTMVSAPLSSLPAGFVITTANGGTVDFSSGKMVVGDLSVATRSGYISNAAIGPLATTIMSEFDFTPAMTYTPMAGGGQLTSSLFEVGTTSANNPVSRVTYSINNWVSQLTISVTSGIQWFGGTGSGTNVLTISGQANINAFLNNTYHVVVLTTMVNTGGLNWTIDNTVTMTGNGNTYTLNYHNTGTATDSSFNPISHQGSVKIGVPSGSSLPAGALNSGASMGFSNLKIANASILSAPLSALPSGFGITTANGGTVDFSSGKMVVGDLSVATRSGYISNAAIGPLATTIMSEFDFTPAMTYTPMAGGGQLTSSLFEAGTTSANNPVSRVTYSINNWVSQLTISVTSGIQWFGGTGSGTNVLTISGQANINAFLNNTYHVTVLTTMVNTGGLNWTIDNTVTMTGNGNTYTLNYHNTGTATDSSFNPISHQGSVKIGVPGGSSLPAGALNSGASIDFSNLNLTRILP